MKNQRFLSVAIIFSLLIWSGSRDLLLAEQFDLNRCANDLRAVVDEGRGFAGLTEEQSQFLHDVFVPATGLRSFLKAPNLVRTCHLNSSSSCFTISDFGEDDSLTFEWVDPGPGKAV